jgi:hypothetical protein
MKYLILSLAIFSFFSCKKSFAPDPVSAEDKAKAKDLAALIQTHNYHLTKYYSLVPIDYIDTDNVVKAETDLWSYASAWLPDDSYSFSSNGDVTIQQNQVKIPVDASAVIKRKWYIVADKDGVRFDFLGHEYQVLQYRLVSFSSTSIVVWAYWNKNKVKVYSEYAVMP